jgi:type I restriction-modification system DNA methylase subunit
MIKSTLAASAALCGLATANQLEVESHISEEFHRCHREEEERGESFTPRECLEFLAEEVFE